MLSKLDMSLEEVLEKSSLAYGHWQGEDGYRIFLRGRHNEYFDVVYSYSKFDAEFRIVEYFYSE